MKKVRVRFAPSPTGPLHIGGVRTALYNYLFAKKHGGDFILRIEDTDQNRYVPKAEDYIIESLKWCGIEPNEGVGFGDGSFAPYRQSERKTMYLKYAEQLVESGNAYYAFDTVEEIEQLKKDIENAGSHNISYCATSRMMGKNSLTLSTGEVGQLLEQNEPYVIRIKLPASQEIAVTDIIRGQLISGANLMDDKVLFKSDGLPTYHLANVVDDYLMGITHVIRGDEWLPSTFLHVLLYEYLGWGESMPEFAHLSLLLKPDGKGKLSKRDGDRLGFPVFPLDWTDPVTSEQSSGYRERGYYPDAFVNMLAFLGWNPGTEQEIFTLDELAKAFSFEHIHKAGAKFDPEKAKWFNEQYLRAKPDVEIANNIRASVKQQFNLADDDVRLSEKFLCKAVQLLKPRVQFEHEMIEKGNYLFIAPISYDETVIAKKWNPAAHSFFLALQESLPQLTDYTTANAEQLFKQVAANMNLKPGDVLQLFRVILSGLTVGVDLFGMVELFGKEEVNKRIENALQTIVR
ncbi:MAG: glutamate--tRNA ligase [Bacteroidia bacterium]